MTPSCRGCASRARISRPQLPHDASTDSPVHHLLEQGSCPAHGGAPNGRRQPHRQSMIHLITARPSGSVLAMMLHLAGQSLAPHLAGTQNILTVLLTISQPSQSHRRSRAVDQPHIHAVRDPVIGRFLMEPSAALQRELMHMQLCSLQPSPRISLCSRA